MAELPDEETSLPEGTHTVLGWADPLQVQEALDAIPTTEAGVELAERRDAEELTYLPDSEDAF